MDLTNKVVVVTGASRGLGRALCAAFTGAGARVAGLVRDTGVATELEAEVGGEFKAIQCDVSDHAAVQRAIDEIKAAFGSIDVLFNNAALYPRVSFLEESPEDWAAALGANVNGMAHCCKAVLPTMIDAGFGRIYNLGSWANLGPIPKSAAYSTSKGAVRALTKAIGADLEELQVDVQVHEWIPGHLNTRMSDFTGFDPAVSANWAVDMVRNDNATARSSIFENDHEWQPPKRLKERIVDLLLLRKLRG